MKTKLECVLCSHLLALHRTSVLRHDEHGQEALVNLLLRNYLHYNLYDQVCQYTWSGRSLQLLHILQDMG